jgi:hypothetical protein
VPLNGSLGLSVFVSQLFKSLFTKDILLKESFLPFVRLVSLSESGATLLAKIALFTNARFTVFYYLERPTIPALFLNMKKG